MPLSHIAMHIALCNSVAREAAHRDVPVRVVLTDKLGRTAFDQRFAVEKGTTGSAPVEFDVPFGVYKADISAASCATIQYFSVLADINRTVDVSLDEGRPRNPDPPAIVQGSSPFEFSYVQPTVLVFPKTLKCNDPIPDPLNADIHMQNSDTSYYASIYPNQVLAQNAPVVLAVRLNDSHGGYQYVRVPIGDAIGYRTPWPSIGQVSITPSLIDEIANKPEDTLLCLRMTKITVGG